MYVVFYNMRQNKHIVITPDEESLFFAPSVFFMLLIFFKIKFFLKNSFRNDIRVSNSLDPDQD